MQAFVDSTLIVALAEMGDKTQLLSLMLVLRYKKPWSIMAAIFLATILNHLAATWIGAQLAMYIPRQYLQYGLAFLFISFGLWLLKPDSEEGLEQQTKFKSAFWIALVAFFTAEMGDKTQLVTVALAAKHEAPVVVAMGSTLGMMVANSLSVFGGERFVKVVPMGYVRIGACVVFVVFGILMLPFW